MKRFGAQLHKKAQNISLSLAERALLRERVVSYMEYHPLPKEKVSAVPAAELVSDPYKVFNFSRLQVGSFMGAFAMIILVVIPVAAERAVPGDVLYPVKVQFSEEVRSTLSFSPYAKVEWETERLERRLAEARLLADEGKLTQEVEAEVAQAVQAHSNAAQEGIATIRSSDSDEAALAEITFASVLEVQSQVLANREEQAGEAGQAISALASAVAEARSGVAASNSTANPPFEKLAARLESETTYAQELFASIQDGASPEQTRDIERRFKDINRKIDEAVALHNAETSSATETATATSTGLDVNSDQEAKQILKVALTDTRKLISFMTDIDVRSNVTIEELVPVTLTEEELGAAFLAQMSELEAVARLVDQLAVETEIVEKFDFGKAEFLATLTAANEAYADNNYDLAIELASEAQLIANDLMRMGVVIPIDSTNPATSTDPLRGGVDDETTASSTDVADDDMGTTSETD